MKRELAIEISDILTEIESLENLIDELEYMTTQHENTSDSEVINEAINLAKVKLLELEQKLEKL